MAEDQSTIDDRNASFWNELCGTQLASSLGVTDCSPASLRKFDDWYFDFYPYLLRHIPFEQMRGKDVLEIGLGFGTVAQRIAEAGARYNGLDIAPGPVAMANQRFRQAGLAGSAEQGSILEAPFSSERFDYVIAIGCLHHTGDLERALEECRHLLRPGGSLVFMVYYAYSYRRFIQARPDTLRYWVRERLGYRGVVGTNRENERAAYDINAHGEAAPHTDWISVTSLKYFCRRFASFSAQIENIDQEPPFQARTRAELMQTKWPRLCGLDIYAHAVK